MNATRGLCITPILWRSDMGEFRISGAIINLTAFSKRLEMAADFDKAEISHDILEAGAKVYEREWKEVIAQNIKNPDRSTGALLDSISYEIDSKEIKLDKKETRPAGRKGRSRKKRGTGLRAGIGPYGYDPVTEVPNMIKAYNMNYGNSRQAGTRFKETVEENAHSEAYQEMSKVFNNYLKEKGVL